ncbi:MAG: hypothetical protein ACHQ0J_01275 [Candidatus Dormibacterales bacterium]
MADLMELTEDRHCRATAKQTKQRCRRWASVGQHVCAIHGGKSPQALEAAEKRLAVVKVREALVKMGVPVEEHPIEVLLQQVAESNGNVVFLRARVQELNLPEQLTTAAIALLELYNQERDRAAKMAKLALDAGVQERQARVAEEQAAQVVDLLRHVFDHPALGLSADQRKQARVIAASRLRLMASPDAWDRPPEDRYP